jgi:Cu(I)/Ag(I) efflux system periplasmic protein CusF
MKKLLPALSVLFIFFAFVACGKQEAPKETSEVMAKTYEAVGQVVSIDLDNNTVMIAHQDIPDLMSAMTMDFQIKDTTLLKGIQPQDSVQFELTASGDEMWISNITKLE